MYYSLAVELRGREVIHFVDNSGALACLVKDYSSDEDSAKLVHTFWALACAFDIDGSQKWVGGQPSLLVMAEVDLAR